jgi:hypothetical protein
MNKPEFTPGSWRAINSEEYRELFDYDIHEPCPVTGEDACIISDEPGYDFPWAICTVHSGQPGECGPDDQLIVSAPEMFELLQRITNQTDDYLGTLRDEAQDLIERITN